MKAKPVFLLFALTIMLHAPTLHAQSSFEDENTNKRTRPPYGRGMRPGLERLLPHERAERERGAGRDSLRPGMDPYDPFYELSEKHMPLSARMRRLRDKRALLPSSQPLHLGQSQSLSDGVQEEWVRQYASGLAQGYDEATAMAVDESGNVYVTGYSSGLPFGADYFTIKYNPSGAQVWTARYNGEGNGDDLALAISLDAVGNVYVTGTSVGQETGADYATIKYNASGVEQWVARYNSSGNLTDFTTAIAVDVSGNVYVIGFSPGTVDDYTTIKYNSSGMQQWVARYNGPGNKDDRATALAVDALGNVYVTGYSYGSGTCDDYATIKYNSFGMQQWVARYNGPGNYCDEATDLAVDDSGNVYVTGRGNPGTLSDYVTIKYNSAGAEQWVIPYNGPAGNGYDKATALVVDVAGNVYVTGYSYRSGVNIDYATIKYSASGVEKWVMRYSGPEYDEATALALDASGNVYVTGFSSASNNYDYATIKYNATGVEQWVARYDGPINDDDIATALAVDASGNVYVTGLSQGSGTNFDYATVKYNSAGFLQWTDRFNSPKNSFDFTTALAVDDSGNVYVTGQSEGSGTGGDDYATIKYNTSGVEQWVMRYNGPGNSTDRANALAVDVAGNVYVTGYSYGSSTSYDYATIKYNSSGMQQWVVHYNRPGNSTDFANALAVDVAGNVYVTGYSHSSSTSSDYATIKYNASGVEQWVMHYNGPGNGGDEGKALAVDDSGNVYVTGSASGSGTRDDYVTIKYNSAGAEQWVIPYNGPGNDYDRATALDIDASGNVYVTGISFSSGTRYDYVTIKYNSAGAEQWVMRYDGPGNHDDLTTDLAVDAAGNVYVTGESRNSSYYHDYATIKYNATGVEQWVARYDGPINDFDHATALGVDASGNVYVTGWSDGGLATTGDDFATVKYNSAGVQQWVARYNGPGGNDFDAASDLAVDASGNVYVTGDARGSGWSIYTTIKYPKTGAPTATTNAATNISATSATLNGTVNPNGLSTTVQFEYGKTASYGNTITAAQSPITGISAVSVNAALSGLSLNTQYHYRVVATNSAGTTTGGDHSFSTTTGQNQAPSAPTLLAPSANAFITDNTPDLTFAIPSDANGDSLHFKVEIDDDGNFGAGTDTSESRYSTIGFSPTPPVTQGSGQGTYTIQTALADGDWWWRVSAWDGQVYGSSSAARKFTVDVVKPFTSNHNPSKSATGVEINTNIVVHVQDSTSGVKRSSIVMKVNGSPVSPPIAGTSSNYTLTYDPPTDFGFQQTVTVSIDAADSAGNVMATDSYSFTTASPGNTAPSAPTLSSPSANAFVDDNFPALVFNVPSDADGDALHFKVEIDADGNFSSGVLIIESRLNPSDFAPPPPVPQGTNQVTYTVATPLADGDWWWRVSAWDGQTYGSSSEERKFIIDTTPPFTSGHSPAKGATGVPINTNIIIHVQDALSGVEGSTIVMKVNGSQVFPASSGTVADLTLTYDPTNNFGYQQTVTVSLDAEDVAGNVMARDTYSFTTASLGNSAPNAPALVSPASDAFLPYNTPGFAFSVPADANGDQLHFKVEVAANSNFISAQTFESKDNAAGFSPMPPVAPGSGQVTFTLQTPLTDGERWWRVSAWDGQVYSDASTPFRFFIDTTPPQVNHTAVTTALTGTSVAIAASLLDNLGVIQSAKLYYRPGGAVAFDSTSFNHAGGNNYQGIIPISAITARGVEYYFSVQDRVGNTRTFPLANAKAQPQTIQVTNSNLIFASPTPPGAYRMISVPFDLDNSSVPVVLNELGSYNDTQWRLLRWSNDKYLEYTLNSDLPSFEPGTGFWLITKAAKTLDAGAGKSVTTAENFKITLPVGWSQIGNPFAFTVNWSDVIRPASVENRLVGYSGNTNTASGYDHTRTQLIPFEGYFVNNLGPGSATIEIPPKSASGSLVKEKESLPALQNLQNNEWMLQIVAQAGRYLDKDNYVGAMNSADNAWDTNDFSEAPFLADHISLYFPHAEWSTFPGNYTGDFRTVNSEGGVWDFEVQSASASVTLSLAEQYNLPSDWEVLLLDKSSQMAWDWSEREQYTFVKDRNEEIRSFCLVVGKSSFVENNDLDLLGVPQTFALSQNYPNPFNPETRMNYEVPSMGRVKIAICNLQGQELRALVEGYKSAGRYVATWDGKTTEGSRVASGVYLVRMEAEKFVAVRKAVLAK